MDKEKVDGIKSVVDFAVKSIENGETLVSLSQEKYQQYIGMEKLLRDKDSKINMLLKEVKDYANSLETARNSIVGLNTTINNLNMEVTKLREKNAGLAKIVYSLSNSKSKETQAKQQEEKEKCQQKEDIEALIEKEFDNFLREMGRRLDNARQNRVENLFLYRYR